ncbi:MAG: hypothetical protein JXA99_06440 [Candidatus Lokiarchaeota archaeon]|nr:hypothetical protein [Candidatus Lokiarchaeota archaeon]
MTEENPIWRLKYLPKALDEIYGRELLISRLKEFIKSKNFPHLLFVGSSGIGKTTIANLFSKEFLGDYFDANLKLVYADLPLTQEERSQAKSESYISTNKIGSMAGKSITTPVFIQVKIKPFVQLKVLGDVPFKILIVKNFEALGSNQQGFRRLMEIYGNNCRMILLTTKISGIIDPIISRCQLFLIPPLKYNKFEELILKISKKESIDVNIDIIKIIYRITEGRISKAIDILQLSSINSNIIDEKIIFESVKKFKNEDIEKLILNSFKGDFKKSRIMFREILSNYKYNANELFQKMLEVIIDLPISRFEKCKLINLIGDADFRALDGIDSDIQISAFISKLNAFGEYM